MWAAIEACVIWTLITSVCTKWTLRVGVGLRPTIDQASHTRHGQSDTDLVVRWYAAGTGGQLARRGLSP